ncbi:MAG: hypothetical protein CR974_02185 [Gammaproteobacteria bacterium]|nr:MAG: hypothetical protein CR974_02185 [Gammaproteobacteria bacterium]
MPPFIQYVANIKIRQFAKNLIFYIVLLMFCGVSYYASSVDLSVAASTLTFFITMIFVIRRSRFFFRLYLVFLFVFSLIIAPIALLYGKLNFGIVVSIMDTNIAEAGEYVTSLPLYVVAFFVGYSLLFMFVLLTAKWYRPERYFRLAQLMLPIILCLSLFHRPLGFQDWGKNSAELLTKLNYPPVSFVARFYVFYDKYLTDKENILSAQKKSSTWKVISAKPKYKNYVIFIGESARRDYHSLYGYPIENSEFMSKVKATVFENYISPDYYTIGALTRTFVRLNNNRFEYENTVVTLANQAGFKTYWLSNQGSVGEYDTIISQIAIRADEAFFANKADYDFQAKLDLDLLPKLAEKINDRTDKSRVIFVHLLGSHQNFCERLDDRYQVKAIKGVISKNLSCYLTSYRQTDKLLSEAYRLLKQSGQSFSMMYFADHGLIHTSRTMGINLKHKEGYKQSLEVPMVVISSDAKDTIRIRAKKDGANFISYFSEWTNIKLNDVTSEKQFFSEYTAPSVGKGSSYESLKDDPVIYPK